MLCTFPMVVFVRERQAAKELKRVKNRCSPELKESIRQTIFELLEKVSRSELRSVDFLRLLQLRDELSGDSGAAIVVGWC